MSLPQTQNKQNKIKDNAMIKISPSILAADFSMLGESISKVEDSADMLHIDVMDGVFVPNISFGQPVVTALRKVSGLLFDVHLMITDPGRYTAEFAKAGADIITIHYESCDDPVSVLKEIRELGVKPSVSIKPGTPAFVLEPLLEYVDMIRVMTVEPGFGGQALIPDTLDSVRAVRKMIEKSGRHIMLEVDGGITESNIRGVYEAGADVFVAGSSVFKAPIPAEAISALKRACE